MSYLLESHENMKIHKAIFNRVLPGALKRVRIASSTLKDFSILFGNGSSTLLFSSYINRLRNEGIRVQILTTPKMLSSLFLRRLNPDVEIMACARNHLKMICVDDSELYVGTANMTSSAVGLRSMRRRNFEIGIFTNEKVSVQEARSIFDRIWSGSYCQEYRYLKRKDVLCMVPGSARLGSLNHSKC